MNKATATNEAAPKPRSFAALAIAFTLAMTAVLPAFLWFGQTQYGQVGSQTALLSFFVCWSAGFFALATANLCRGLPNLAMAGMLGGMMFRMGAPLFALLMLRVTEHPSVAAGADGMLVVYYLIALAVETPLSLLLVNPHPRATGVT